MGARVSVDITEEDGRRQGAVQAGEDWKACVQLRVHRPVRLDTDLVLTITGEERVRIEPNKLHPVVHKFLTEKKVLVETQEGAPPTLLPPDTYTYPISVPFPAESLPTLHIRRDRGPTGISASGRDMAHGSVQYKAKVQCSSFQREHLIKVMPSPAASPWHSQIVGPQAAEMGMGRIFWGAAVDATLVYRGGDEFRLYVSLVNESTANIRHLRVELVETVSLSSTDVTRENTDYLVRKFPEVLWRLERAPLDEDLETGHKLVDHVAEMAEPDLEVSRQAVLDDLEHQRLRPIAITVPRTARPSHTGRLTRTQHQLRLTLLTNKKNSQLMVPLWVV